MINRQNQLWALAERPELTWNEHIPHSSRFEDIYFSVTDGEAESRYVFLEGCEFEARASAQGDGHALTLVETGFGTGLNFLLSVASWCQNSKREANLSRLHYVGIDNWPLSKAQLERVHAERPHLNHITTRLLADWPNAVRGCHRVHWDDWGVTLDLWWEDVAETLADMASRNRRQVDLWYLDGFAPSRDESMWSKTVFELMARLSNPSAGLGTFTAATSVRKGLQEVGFEVTKRPGFGHKRECLRASFPKSPPALSPHTQTPWDLNPLPYREPANREPVSRANAHALGATATTGPALKTYPETDLGSTSQEVDTEIVILGAGLAGASVAQSLAMRGIPVTVIDKAGVASGGSSHLQGLTYTRLSRRFAPLGDFALASFGYATRRYRQLMADPKRASSPLIGEQCGYLQASSDTQTLDYLQQALGPEESPAQILDSRAASGILGLPQDHRCLFFPDAFWLNPASVCRHMLDHPLITVLEKTGEPRIQQQGKDWLIAVDYLKDGARSGSVKYRTPTLILATAHELKDFELIGWLPLQAIRGQTSHVKATEQSLRMSTAFCHEGYLPPAWQEIHCMGASYGPNDVSLDERVEDHQSNLATLRPYLSDIGFPQQAQEVSGHVALRCTSSDYLPIVGPAPDREAFNKTYADLGKQKSRLVSEDCPVIPGLWIIGGLGSRGLTAAPMAAELLASELLGEPAPLPRYLQQALAPARFLARGLIRGQPL